MAIPILLDEWASVLDPSDTDRFFADLVDPNGPPLLEAGEEVGSFTVSLQLESSSLGLTASNATLIDLGRRIQVWLSVDPLKRGDAAFDDEGVALPVTFTVTIAVPVGQTAPVRQRSILVRVRQR